LSKEDTSGIAGVKFYTGWMTSCHPTNSIKSTGEIQLLVCNSVTLTLSTGVM